MNPSASIVAATDFSAHARHAAERAARIAREHAATLTLLHVLPGAPMAKLRAWLGGDDGAPPEHLLDEAGASLQACIERLPPATSVESLVSEGSVLDEILDAADRLDARLIVLGARGAGFVRRAMIGGSAERLVRRSARPVLVVRQTPHEAYQRVLVAVDFSEVSAQLLAIARWIAPQAHLVLTTVFEVPFEGRLRLAGVAEAKIDRYREQARQEARRSLMALADRAGLPPQCWQACIVEGDPSFRLLELEQEQDCDLVVVGKHSRSGATDMLLGSVTHRVLADGAVDVLIAAPRNP